MTRSKTLNALKILKRILLTALLSIISNTVFCQGLGLEGQWYESPMAWTDQQPPTNDDLKSLKTLKKLPRTGGQFIYVGEVEIDARDRYVLDFAYSTLIGLFEYRLYDEQGSLFTIVKGGIQSAESNPYPIRHGRPVELPGGRYTVVTNLSAPYFIAAPAPLIIREADYQPAIKKGNLIAFTGIGIFFAMAIFYLCFAISRKSTTDLAYTIFILGNLLFNSIALNIAPDIFGVQHFQLSSYAIFVSNIAYIFFVRGLLQIKKETDPSLYYLGSGIIAIFVVLAILGVFFEHWAMEICRIGVAIFLGYGLFAGLTYALQKVTLAYYYLLANLCFLIPATISIWPEGFESFSNPTLYSAHMGIIAVSIEVLLLGLVQAYQINRINRERLLALDKAANSQKAARTDMLTGAPNRNAFEEAFCKLTEEDSFTYIDLDGLKYYNDNFGHHRGDDLLREFSVLMMNNLSNSMHFFRIAGDEFGIISKTVDAAAACQAIDHTVELLQARGFTLCGASYGQASYLEADSPFNLKKVADARMYSVKARKKKLASENR